MDVVRRAYSEYGMKILGKYLKTSVLFSYDRFGTGTGFFTDSSAKDQHRKRFKRTGIF